MKRVDVAAAERVTAFLVAAQQLVPTLQRGSLPHSRTALPELFASDPTFAAAVAALQRLGGDLKLTDLDRTGIVGLLASGEQFDSETVGTDLARYATGGDVKGLKLVGLNACDLPEGPLPIAGWELVRLGRSGVEDLMPVPAAARFMSRPGWDLTAAAATWWLRRSTGRKARRKGLILDFSTHALYEGEEVAAPLLVLALADDAPLKPLSSFVVEVGVAVHPTRGEELAYDEFRYGPGENDVRPQFHDHEYYAHFGGRRSSAQQSKLWHFCKVVGPMAERVYQKASIGDHAAERFTRAAGHFLDVVMGARPDVPPRHQAALGLSIALETLLETRGPRKVTKKFTNGAAWLGGRDHAEREAIRTLAKDLYDAGSKYRHGSELVLLYDSRDPNASWAGEKALDIAKCRALARKLLLRRLMLLDSGIQISMTALCETAISGRDSPFNTNVIDKLYSTLHDSTYDALYGLMEP